MNALVGKRISIVQDQPGVTRDRISYPLQVDDRWIELVDTGGYGFIDSDNLTDHIAHQIELAMARADLVLFVVDCDTGLTSADQEIASLLRHKSLRVVLVANKADGPNADTGLADFARLGFGTPVGVSALRERNLDLVFDAIRKNVRLEDAPTEMPTPLMHVAIVGKRNAGKSTLVNSIAKLFEGDGDRVIVSEVPGTTRDSIDVRFEKEGKTLVVIDTAGVRKKRHMATNDIEFYSFHRAQRSIRRADVIIMLIDATEVISEPDKKLAQYINEQMKPVVVVINKWDLALGKLKEQRKDGEETENDSKIMEKYGEYVDAELKHLDYAPLAFTTAKDGRNIQEVIDLCQHLHKQANYRMSTSKLNDAIEQIVAERQPSFPGGRKPKIYYATQTAVAPPTIVLFVNMPEHVQESYRRFVINRMRELLPFEEVPINLQIRGRSGRNVAPEMEGKTADSPRGKVLPTKLKVLSRAKQALPKNPSRAGSKPVGKKKEAATHVPFGQKGKRPMPKKPQPKKEGRKGPSRGMRPR